MWLSIFEFSKNIANRSRDPRLYDTETCLEVTSDGRKKSKTRIRAKDGGDNNRGQIMPDPEGKKIRRRHTRVRNPDDDEDEYQLLLLYDYDEDSLDSEGNPKPTRTKTPFSSEIDPIYKKLPQGKKSHDEQDKSQKQFIEENSETIWRST